MKEEGILEQKGQKNPENNISKTIILGLVGLILLLLPKTLNSIIGIIVGIALIIIGIYPLYRFLVKKIGTNLNLISGILYVALGVIVIASPQTIINLLSKCLGVYLMITGILKLKTAFTLKNTNTLWVGTLVIGIVTFGLGLFLLLNPFSGVFITKISGAFLTVVAIADIVDVYYLQKH